MKPYWSSPEHKLSIFHGDCLEVMPALEQEFDLCLTDPPYNVGYEYATHDDRMPVDEYRAWQLAVAEALAEVCAPVSDFWYLQYPEFAAYMFSAVPEVTAWTAREWVTWIYHTHTGGVPLRKASRAWCWFALGGGREAVFTQEYRNPTDRRVALLLEANRQPSAYDWWECEQVKNVSDEKTAHPCQVPVAMVERIVGGMDATAVIDPFLGSGTTLVACYRLGRHGVGIEISEEYCELAAKRLEVELTQLRLPETVETAKPAQPQMDTWPEENADVD